ncbi:MAG: RHS repeat-associated core domain-containing protein, partial [Thermoanaerobaculia bacterium]
LEAVTPDGAIHYHADHLGTPRLLTDGSGDRIAEHDYLPFGEELSEAGDERLKFTGHERDQGAADWADLDYMHARYYNPNLGRFLSVDPVLQIKRAMADPQGWNRYAYVRNNPLSSVDRDGKVDEYAYERRLMEEQLAVRQGGMTSDQYRQNNEGRAGAAVLGAAPYALPLAFEAAGQFTLRQLVRFELWKASVGGGAAVTADGLRRAAEGGGPTVQIVTNLTRAPQEGRALSAAAGEGATALTNAARGGEGARTFAANIPQALLNGLQQAGLLEVRKTMMNGATGTEYRFAPAASVYVVRFFRDITDK